MFFSHHRQLQISEGGGGADPTIRVLSGTKVLSDTMRVYKMFGRITLPYFCCYQVGQ